MPPRKKKIIIEEIIKPPEIIKPEIINFYELEGVKKYEMTYNNPNYDFNKMPLKHPLRLLVIGSSGSGKTNVLLNIISKMDETFNNLILFTKNADEPLYQYLQEKIPQIQVYEGLEELNKMNLNEEFQGQTLIIFDDLVLEKHQEQISQLFIRGRKLANKRRIFSLFKSSLL
jgi:D-Tyr-tRNAtyr deacylase